MKDDHRDGELSETNGRKVDRSVESGRPTTKTYWMRTRSVTLRSEVAEL